MSTSLKRIMQNITFPSKWTLVDPQLMPKPWTHAFGAQLWSAKHVDKISDSRPWIRKKQHDILWLSLICFENQPRKAGGKIPYTCIVFSPDVQTSDAKGSIYVNLHEKMSELCVLFRKSHETLNCPPHMVKAAATFTFCIHHTFFWEEGQNFAISVKHLTPASKRGHQNVVCGSGPGGSRPHNRRCVRHHGKEQPRLGRTAAVE